MIQQFQRPMTQLLLEFGDEVLDAVREQHRINVDDVRDKLLGPLRRRLRQLDESAAAAQNTSSTFPSAGASGA